MVVHIFGTAHDVFNPYAIPTLVIAFATLSVTLRRLILEKFSLVARALALVGTAITVWLISNYFTYTSADDIVALQWARISNIGISFIPATIYHFAVVALRTGKKHRATIWTGWILAALFSAAALNTDLIVKGVVHYPWGYQGKNAPQNSVLIIYMLTFFGLGLRVFWTAQKQAAPNSSQYHRIKAFLLAFGIGSLGLVDYLPGAGVPVFPIGCVAVFIALWILELTISRYRLVDITPRFAAQSIIDTMNDALLVLDGEGVIRLVNDPLTRVLGHPESELLGTHITALFNNTTLAGQMADSIGKGPAERLELSYDHPNGNKQILDLSASVMKDENSRLLAHVYIIRDITALRHAETELRKSHAELEIRVQERTADLVKANGQLKREIDERKTLENERAKLVDQLQNALDNVKTLRGFIPICASCKNIRDDKGYWSHVEAYISEHTLAEFSHSICPKCAKKMYPEFYPEGGERQSKPT